MVGHTEGLQWDRLLLLMLRGATQIYYQLHISTNVAVHVTSIITKKKKNKAFQSHKYAMNQPHNMEQAPRVLKTQFFNYYSTI